MSNTSKKTQILNSASSLGLMPQSNKEKLGLRALEPRILLDAAGFVTGAEVAMDAMNMSDARMGVEAIFSPEAMVTNSANDQLIRALESEESIKAAEYVIPVQEFKDPKSTDYVIPTLDLKNPIFADGLESNRDEQDYSTYSVDGYELINPNTSSDYRIAVSDIKEYGEQIAATIEATSNEITVVFVDTSVQNYQTLIDGLPEGTEVILIETDVDGVEFIAETLEGRTDIDAVHILSHGAAGEITLGTATLNSDSITGEYADELAIIRGALSAEADILLYGCDFGDDIGAVNALAQATGADIAASNDDTGAAAVGGDWNLEVQSGDITAEAFSISAFTGILADRDGDGIDDSVDVDDDNDGILDAEEGVTVTTTDFVGFTVAADGLSASGTIDGIGITVSITPTVPSTPALAMTLSLNGDNHLILGGGTGAEQVENSTIVTITLDEPVLDFSYYASSFGITSGSNVYPAGTEVEYHSGFMADGVAVTPTVNGNLEYVTSGPEAGRVQNSTGTSGTNGAGRIDFGSFPDTVNSFSFTHTRLSSGLGFIFEDVSFTAAIDTDGDGVFNHLDLDSDNDGISDLQESGNAAGVAADVNNDGTIDSTESTDVDGDGAMEVFVNDPPAFEEGFGTVGAPSFGGFSATGSVIANDALGDTSAARFNVGNGANPDGVITQTITTVVGETYRIAFDTTGINPGGQTSNGAAGGTLGDIGNLTLEVFDGSTLLGTETADVPDDRVSRTNYLTFVATSTSTIITLSDTSTAAGAFGSDLFLTNVEMNTVGTAPRQSDSDGVDDYLDLDSDGDGIADAIEARATIAGNVITAGGDAGDSDDDGVLDHFDTSNDGTFGGNFATLNDDDNDGTPDYISTDSDGDGISDATESGLVGTPTDFTYLDADGTLDPATLTDVDNDATDVDFRSVQDTDGDGVGDFEDIDDDNDGILDSVEGYQIRTGVTVAAWTGNADAGPFAGHLEPDAEDATFGTNYSNLIAGPGLDITADPAWSHNLSGLDQATRADAAANGDYIEITFTSGDNISELTEIAFGIEDSPQRYGYSVGVEISVDNFATEGTVLLNTATLPEDSGGGYQFLIIPLDTVLQLQQNTDYTVRLIIFDNPAGNGTTADFNDYHLFGNEYIARDTDSDGIADHIDLDTDNDGIADLVESGDAAGIALDTNNDGTVNLGEGGQTAALDVDEDGLLAVFDVDDTNATLGGGTNPLQTADGDGIADYLDLDSDGDGIADAIESRATNGYNSITSITDTDGDGIIDQFDGNMTFGGANLADPVDTDAASDLNNNPDDLADYIDTDSDGDGILDSAESFPNTAGTDTNGDGIRDDRGSYADPDGTTNPSADLDNFVGDTSEVAYRELNLPVIVDLGDDTTTADRDHEVTTVIGDTISVNPIASDGGVFDTDSVAVTQVIIEVDESTFLDSSDEFFVIGGEDISLDSESVPAFATQNTVISVNGSDYTVQTTRVNSAIPAFGGPSVLIRIVQTTAQGDGQIPLADMNAILQGLTYRNDAGSNATEGDRVYTVRAIGDQPDTSTDSNTATGTISVTDPDPIIDLNDNNTTADLNFAVNPYSEGDGAVAVVDTDAEVLDGADNINELEIVVGGAVDGDDEIISFGGEEFTLGTDKDFTIVNPAGDDVLISYAAGTFTITITNATTAGEPIPAGDLTDLIQDIYFEHNSNDPTAGIRTLSFTATDDGGNTTATAAVSTITVVPVNDPPVAQNDSLMAAEDASSTTGSVLSNNGSGADSDVENETLIVSMVDGDVANVGTATAGTMGGLFTINADGSVSFDSNSDFEDLDVGETRVTVITYEISDGNGGTDTASVSVVVQGANDAPSLVAGVAIPTQTGNDSTALTALNTSSLFEDIDVETLTFSSPDTPSWMMIDSATGIITGTPPANASQGGPLMDGVYTVTVTATDPDGESVSTTVTYNLLNPAPVVDVATSDTDAVDGETVSITSDFSDPDGDTLSYTATGLPNGLSINSVTGEITGTLDANASQVNGGVYTITVTADDGEGGTVTDTFDLAVNNIEPVAVDDVLTANENQIIMGNVITGSDSDPDGDAIVVSRVNGDPAAPGSAQSGTNGGQFTINTDGSFSFDPNGDFETLDLGETATTTITYEISDGEGGTDTATVTITVQGGNDAPIVTGTLAAQLGEDSVAQVPFDASIVFSDIDDEPLTYSSDNLPSWMSIDSMTGEITGTPPADASQGGLANDGVYVVNVTAADPDGEDVTTQVTYTFTNPAPIIDTPAADIAATDGETVSILTDISDPDGDTLSYVVTGLPTGLMIDADTGEITGTIDSAASQVNGGVYTVTVTADDGEGGSITDTFDITVTNQAPEVDTPVGPQTGEDNSAISIPTAISDPEGDDLTYSVTGLPTGLSIDPDTGEITGTVDPSASLGGPLGDGVYTVAVTADDSEGGTITDTFTFTATNPGPVVDTPIGNQTADDADLVSITPSISDPDGDTLTYSVTGLPTGLSIIPSTGEIVGTIDPSASIGGPLGDGVYTVVVTADDGEGGSVTDTFTYTITNPAPTAVDDAANANEGASITGVVILGSDSDPDQDTLSVSQVNGDAANVGVPVTGSDGGEFTINPDGTFTFDPNGDFETLDVGETATTTITYEVSDGEGGTDTATVTITVNGTNDAPITTGTLAPQTGTDSVVQVPFDASTVFSDIDAEPLTYSSANLPSWMLIDATSGEITGTPPSDASQGGANSDGIYVITITATDPDGESVDANVVYTFENTAPVAQNDVFTTAEDTPLFVNVIPGSDSDSDGDTLAIDMVALPDGTMLPIGITTDLPEGVLTVNVDGSVEFDPADDFNGPFTFGYTVSDGEGGTDVATVTINVTDVNDAPELDLNGADTGVDETIIIANDDPSTPIIPDTLIADVDSTTLTSVTGTVGGNADGEGEAFTLGGEDLAIGTGGRTFDVTQGGTTFTVVSDGTSFTATVSGGTGDAADVNALVATLSYEHTQNPPTLGNRTVTLSVTDDLGLASNDTTVTVRVVEDTTPPAAPEVDPPMQEPEGELTVTGTGEPGSTVKVLFADGTIGTAEIAADGSWSVTSETVQTSGDIAVTVCDNTGNESPPTTENFVDNNPPLPPVIEPPVQGPEGELTVRGTGEPGSTIKVTFPNGETGEALVAADGTWTLTSTTVQTSGDVVTTQCDDVGNESPPTTENFVDNNPPLPPVIEPPVQGPEGELTVTGTGEPGSTIKVVFPNGETGEALVAADGTWTLTSTTVQTSGDVVTTQCDPAGNESPPTTQSFADNTPPLAPTLDEPEQNPDGTLTVTGEGEPGSTVTVTYPDGSTETALVAPDGTWTATSETPQSSGNVTATQTDEAGNESSEVEEDFVDENSPLPPVIEPPVQGPEGELTVRGTGEPGSTIKVAFPNGETGEALVAADGTWSLTSMTVQAEGDVVTTQCDPDGNESPPTTQSYADTIPPLAPTVDEPEQNPDGTLTVTGEGEPGATVTVTYPDGSTGTALVAPDGTWTATSETPQPSGDVTATQTDPAGNESSNVVEDFIDNNPPLPPTIEIQHNNDTGLVDVTGTGEPGATITLTFPNGETVDVVVDADGNYSATSKTPQSDGDVIATQTDTAGNVSDEADDDYSNLDIVFVDLGDNGQGSITGSGNVSASDNGAGESLSDKGLGGFTLQRYFREFLDRTSNRDFERSLDKDRNTGVNVEVPRRGDGTDHVTVATVAFEHNINVQLTAALVQASDVKSWSVSLANGGSLPSWVEYVPGSDFFEILRPLDQDSIKLRVKAVLDNGRTVSKVVDIDLRTGVVEDEGGTFNQAQTLNDQLTLETQKLASGSDDLIKSLAS